MTIAKGQPWGTRSPLPSDGVIVSTDAEASAVIAAARQRHTSPPPLGLVGGDLCRTVGGTGDRTRLASAAAVRFPIDVGIAAIDGHEHPFVAHVVARNRTWTRVFVALNAEWIGAWNAGPRAHPDDALLDTFDCRLRLGELRRVSVRLRTGSHLPHPRIRERRTAELHIAFERPLGIWVDGVRVAGNVREMSVRVEADAAQVVV